MLDVLKRYGIVAGVTEYAAKGIEPKGGLLNNTCCDYWTSTNADCSIGKAYTVGGFEITSEPSWTSENGIRLIVPIKELIGSF